MAQLSLEGVLLRRTYCHKFKVSAVEFGVTKEMAIFEILISSSYLKDMH